MRILRGVAAGRIAARDRLAKERDGLVHDLRRLGTAKTQEAAPAAPKHSPPRQARPVLSSAASSKNIARPCDERPRRLQIAVTSGKT